MTKLSPSQPETSLVLLETLQKNDEADGWRDFVFAYSGLVRRWLRGWGLQQADAEDVWQLVLLDAFKGIRTYQPREGCKFRSWLRKLTWHAMIRQAKRNGRQTPGSGSTSVLMALHEVPDQRAPTYPIPARMDPRLAKALERVQKRVSANEWRAFSLFHFEEQTGPQVAAALRMTVASVHAACSKVRVLLRQLSAEH